MIPWLLLSLATLSAATHPTENFLFDYDETQWEIAPPKGIMDATDQSLAHNTLVILQRKIPDDQYYSRFSVVVDNLNMATAKSPLLAYRDHARGFLEKQRFRIISSETVKLPKLASPAIEIVASQRDFGLTFRQMFFITGNKVFLLTLGARTSVFDERSRQARSFFETFRPSHP